MAATRRFPGRSGGGREISSERRRVSFHGFEEWRKTHLFEHHAGEVRDAYNRGRILHSILLPHSIAVHCSSPILQGIRNLHRLSPVFLYDEPYQASASYSFSDIEEYDKSDVSDREFEPEPMTFMSDEEDVAVVSTDVPHVPNVNLSGIASRLTEILDHIYV